MSVNAFVEGEVMEGDITSEGEGEGGGGRGGGRGEGGGGVNRKVIGCWSCFYAEFINEYISFLFYL